MCLVLPLVTPSLPLLFLSSSPLLIPLSLSHYIIILLLFISYVSLLLLNANTPSLVPSDSHLSKVIFLVSSWVVTTGAERRATTCSPLGCSAPRRPRPAVPLCEVGDVREDTHRVSQNTSCLSWSTSITTALESDG